MITKMDTQPFICVVEKRFGKFPHFLLCMILEWVLIIILFLDGFFAFFAYEFAKYFDLEVPCWLCSRMNHALSYRTHDFYYNNSICEAHKKDVSSLGFCHNHKKLSDTKKMCEGCQLSFVTQKETECDPLKSLVGVLQKVVEDGHKTQTSFKDDGDEKTTMKRCSCCGEPMRAKSFSKGKNSGSFIRAPTSSPRAPTASPRAPNPYMASRLDESRSASPRAPHPYIASKIEESRDLDSPRIRFARLKLMSENGSELLQNEDGNNAKYQDLKSNEEAKLASLPLLTDPESLNNESPKIPAVLRGNKFFGIPLESPSSSPRWAYEINRKSPLEKTEFASESQEDNNQIEDDGILGSLNKQVTLDHTSLKALFKELEEERNASEIAANNAMAMITRLQEEKAALQMDSFQYQRMLEEQIEYDEEALQDTNDMLLKLEEDVKALETELDLYRNKYGFLPEEDFKDTYLSHGGNSSPTRLTEAQNNEESGLNSHTAASSQADNLGGKLGESLRDFQMEKTYLLGRKKMENRTPMAESEYNSDSGVIDNKTDDVSELPTSTWIDNR